MLKAKMRPRIAVGLPQAVDAVGGEISIVALAENTFSVGDGRFVVAHIKRQIGQKILHSCLREPAIACRIVRRLDGLGQQTAYHSHDIADGSAWLILDAKLRFQNDARCPRDLNRRPVQTHEAAENSSKPSKFWLRQ